MTWGAVSGSIAVKRGMAGAGTRSMATTYTKLRNGDWGLRGTNLCVGQTVTVSKRDGSTKSETVGRVLWSGEDGACLATVAREQSAPRHSQPRRGWAPCGYPGCSPDYCDECDGEGRWAS